MSEFLAEVDEAMKQERLEKLWKKYGGLFLSFLVMIVLSTASYEGYHAWVKHRNAQQTNLYMSVLEEDGVSADMLLSLLPKVTTPMKTIISLRAAGLALDNGDTGKALEIYKAISADISQKKESPDLVAMAGYIAVNLDDKMSAQDKIESYKTIADEQNNPWRYNALLDVALLEASQNNNYKKSREYLARITKSDSSAIEGLKKKAQSLDILYMAEQSDAPLKNR